MLPSSSTLRSIVLLCLILLAATAGLYRFVSSRVEKALSSVLPEINPPELSLGDRPPDRGKAPLNDTHPGSFRSPKENSTENTAPLSPPHLDNLVLLGTVSGTTEKTYAVIGEKDVHRQRIYKLGDSIHGGVITRIFRDKVVIRLQGRDWVLALGREVPTKNRPKGPKGRGLGPEARTVSLPDTPQAYAEVLNKIDLSIHPLDEGIPLLEIKGIPQGSFLQRMGLRGGDLIEEIDGRPIRDPEGVLLLCQRLKSIVGEDPSRGNGLREDEVIKKLDISVIQVVWPFLPLVKKVQSGDEIPLTIRRKGVRETLRIRFR